MSEEVIRHRMTSSEAEELVHLTERVWLTPAARVLRADDLWIALPVQRLEVPDEQAVEE